MVHRRIAAFATAVALLTAGFATVPAVARAGSANTAALQVALRADGLYAGSIDGLTGPATRAATAALQRRSGLTADGVAGPRTRAALGSRGRPAYGSRTLVPGSAGWDVAALQYLLAAHGFPSGPIDGGFGPRVAAAVLRFQAYAGLPRAGVAGPATRAALAAAPARSPISFAAPVAGPIGDRWGPRGNFWHSGVDFPADVGVPVRAAAGGTVTAAGDIGDGYGIRVILAHGSGVSTLYAHLERATVVPGERVVTGERIGLVGSTGHSTGPHLHFEVIVRGAEIDPLTALR